MFQAKTKSHGFALIVVLSTLSIIALLFAIAGSRAVNRLSETRTDVLVAEDAFARMSLLSLAAQVYGHREMPLEPDVMLPVRWRGGNALLQLQDTGGLVDLNTANPAILERLADRLNIPSANLETYRVWRREPLRLQRVSDFARIVGGAPGLSESMRGLATVFSGRPGLDMDLAPESLLELLVGRAGNRADLIRDLPASWASPASSVNYHVNVINKGGVVIALGIISITGQSKGLIISSF